MGSCWLRKCLQQKKQIYSQLTTYNMEAENHREATKLSDIPHHILAEFSEAREPHIFFNSRIDSGNMKKVARNSFDHYSIWTAADAEGSQFEGYPKSWFYFQVGGFKNRKVTFSIHRVHFLWAMSRRHHLYRPVFRVLSSEEGQAPSQWERLPHPVQSLSLNNEEELVLKFDYYFPANIKGVEFAFLYPYSHEECHQDIQELAGKYSDDSDIFFKSYELCRSYEGRALDFVLISSHEGKEGVENIKVDSCFTLGNKKLTKFRDNKPIIFISARVHPIETPSSFTMTGIIKFLLDKNDYRAHLLRKYFVFALVPMLNPDGVSNGHCRMDALNQNLNRYYKTPEAAKQPSCYSVKKLCEHYSKDKRLFMYLDLHAHPANKGNFIFGNAIFDFIEQVESHLFPKILSQNCINFEFQQCIFSRKHMKAKDRNEDMNKEGCGRVVFYKQFGLTHAYTLECGYHCNTYNNVLTPETNTEKAFIVRYKTNEKGQNIYDNFEIDSVETNEAEMMLKLDQLKESKGNKGVYQFKILKITADALDDNENEYYKREVPFYEPSTFYNLGRNICISILDVWNKNPYTRVFNANEQRKEIADKQAKLDRFRKEQAGIKTKQKKIVELIETQFYAEWHKRNVFQIPSMSDAAKKTMEKMSNKNKRTEKSITTTDGQKPSLSLSSNPRQMKHQINSRKPLVKEEKKIGSIEPQIESIKTLCGIADNSQMSLAIKAHVQSRSLFKPLNLRIRNVQIGMNRK